MLIRLDKLGAEPFRWQEQVGLTAASLGRAELLDLGTISVDGEVTVERPGFRVEAVVSYRQTVACDRCLVPIEKDLESRLRLLVLVAASPSEESEVELSAEDLEVLNLTDQVLDTLPVITEQVELNVPMRTLCKPDCQGLCPTCGSNRNLEACTCEQATVDPRWEALKGWKA